MKDLVGCACTIQQLLPLNLQYLQGVLKIIAIKKSHIEWIKFWSIHISRVLSIMPKIPEISVGIQMERSVSVSSDRNIRDHLLRWSTYFGWNIPIEIRCSIFDKPVLCPN